jgi:hypothetical protein
VNILSHVPTISITLQLENFTSSRRPKAYGRAIKSPSTHSVSNRLCIEAEGLREPKFPFHSFGEMQTEILGCGWLCLICGCHRISIVILSQPTSELECPDIFSWGKTRGALDLLELGVPIFIRRCMTPFPGASFFFPAMFFMFFLRSVEEVPLMRNFFTGYFVRLIR